MIHSLDAIVSPSVEVSKVKKSCRPRHAYTMNNPLDAEEGLELAN
jgi:hypothetical protein